MTTTNPLIVVSLAHEILSNLSTLRLGVLLIWTGVLRPGQAN